MKLINIQLKNIGPYEDNLIEFGTNPSKNIVLICGENGAGKTTLLNSIKLGLFGSFLYGLKQKSKSNTYVSEIKSIISNDKDYGTITLQFSIIEDYLETIYDLKRSWVLEPSFKELVELKVNGEIVSEDEFLNKMEYINRYFNPKLVDSMMFDGEKIINYIDEETFDDYIRENIIYSFGLNYYLDLIADLDTYIEKQHTDNNLTVEQIRLNELNRTFKNLEREISAISEKIKSLKSLKEKTQFEFNEKLDEFIKLGGLSKRQLEELTTSLKDIENNKVNQNALMRDFFENDLFLKINAKLLKRVNEQIELEKPSRYINYLEEIESSELLTDNEHRLLKEVKGKFKNISSPMILSLSSYDDECFKDLTGKIKSAALKYESIMNQILNDEDLIFKLKKQIKTSKREEVNETLKLIELLTKKNDKINDELYKTEEILKNTKVERDNIFAQLSELKQQVYNQYKDNDSFILANKYKDICQNFYNSELSEIIEKVSLMSTKVLKTTYRKKDYISKINISKDFHISAFYGRKEKNLKQLSAGEKQIFVASVMFSIIKCSNRNIPLIYDSPVGRLDNEHMANFFDKIMARSGSQVIIMPTSKEINDEVINTISNKVSNCYTLEYQQMEKH